MIGLILAILIFNTIAFMKNKRLSGNQIVHIWTFTTAFQIIFDVFIEFKYHGYWYFDKEIDWVGLLPHLFLVPAANIIFLKWFPFKTNLVKQILYLVVFVIIILLYELVTLLPEPWGYFHYGWWRIWHAVIINPILLLILLGYYKWICKLEEKVACKKHD
ncbi:hypothetical protein BABA_20321 [Neobacillus bataviensis LMG 21833]|uniref:Uncharacterized protein n=1 Tax=Neobacillus bataviensis LMG 21833 TaxID=1117379 RepID=K6DXG3_9BACI|nr:hypothetical protein [Neobacillus bataviensis]EKN65521.1 hypothetical protein BABA_20321 [Neobacillus bataviensis LMG 21833]